MKTHANLKIGGALLLVGIVIFFITIYQEINLGWIGSPRSQDPSVVPHFINEHWDSLKRIWGLQAFACFLFTLGYFHLSKVDRTLFHIPIGSLWAVLFVISLMVLVSFGITLGAYGHAVSVYDSNPDLFTTIRSAVLGLHGFGRDFNMLVMLIIFVSEVFAKDGVVPRILGYLVLGLLILSFALMFAKMIPGKMIGLSYFLMPLTLGFCYLKYNTQTENDAY